MFTSRHHLGHQLHIACEHGKVSEVVRLVQLGAPVNWTNTAGWTPLHTACNYNRPACVEVLLQYHANVNTKNRQSDTPLHKACHHGNTDCVKLLMASNKCNIGVFNNADLTPLGLAVRQGMCSTVKYIVQDHKLTLSTPVTRAGDTSLELAIHEGHLDIVKLLTEECGENIRDFHLLTACKLGRTTIVHYFLSQALCDPNCRDHFQRTPLSLAKNSDIINLLLKYGAQSVNAYEYHRKSVGNVCVRDPLRGITKVLVMGDPGEGKSTLIRAIEHEPTIFRKVSNVFISARMVNGSKDSLVGPGIFPRQFKSSVFGNALFYDFSSHRSYHACQSSVLESLISTIPSPLVLVIDVRKDEAKIQQTLDYWLSMVGTCSTVERKTPLLVVYSHSDLVKTKAEITRKKTFIARYLTHFEKFDLVDVIPMDTRYTNSEAMRTLRRRLLNIGKALHSNEVLTLVAHLLLLFLSENFQNLVSLNEVRLLLEARSKQNLEKDKNVVPFIPTEIPLLVGLLEEINNKGHILFIEDKERPKNSFIVLSKIYLLSEVFGTLFAPTESNRLVPSSGIIERLRLKNTFPKVDVDELVKLFFLLKLATPLQDRSQNLLLTNETNSLLPQADQLSTPPPLPVSKTTQIQGKVTVQESVLSFKERQDSNFDFTDSDCEERLFSRKLSIIPAEDEHMIPGVTGNEASLLLADNDSGSVDQKTLSSIETIFYSASPILSYMDDPADTLFYSAIDCGDCQSSHSLESSLGSQTTLTMDTDSSDGPDRTVYLAPLQRELWDVRAKWDTLALELNFTPGDCEQIERDHRKVNECFSALLKQWLSYSPKLADLLEALRSPTIHRADLADDLEHKLLTGQLELW